MNPKSLAPYAKSIIAFVAPAATALIAATQDGSPGGSAITSTEWLVAGLTAVVTSATVWAVPNKDRTATHQDESVQPPAL